MKKELSDSSYHPSTDHQCCESKPSQQAQHHHYDALKIWARKGIFALCNSDASGDQNDYLTFSSNATVLVFHINTTVARNFT